MGPFHKRQKNMVLCDSKRTSFITYFFELQFDTATLIIPSFRMIKATGGKQRFKSDLSRIRIGLFPVLSYRSSIARSTAAVLMT